MTCSFVIKSVWRRTTASAKTAVRGERERREPALFKMTRNLWFLGASEDSTSDFHYTGKGKWVAYPIVCVCIYIYLTEPVRVMETILDQQLV